MFNVSLEVAKIYLEAAEKIRKLAEEASKNPDKKDLVKPLYGHFDVLLKESEKYTKIAELEMMKDFLK